MGYIGWRIRVGTDIAVDNSGNSYTTGFYRSEAIFGKNEANETTLSISGQNDIFIAKFKYSYNSSPRFSIDGALVKEEDFEGTQSISVVPEQVPESETNQVTTYSITPSSSNLVDFSFDENTGTLSFAAKQDQYGEQHFTITADDGGKENYSYTQDFVLIINPVNDVPVITGQTTTLTIGQELDLPIFLDVITVEDVDNSFPGDFSLSIAEGDKYWVSDNIVTPKEGVLGTLSVPVTVNDGQNSSEPFSLTIEVVEVTGVKEKLLLNAIATYPNPVRNILTVSLNDQPNGEYILEIYSLDGIEIHSSNIFKSSAEFEQQINLAPYPHGTYLLRIKGKDGIGSKKIIK